MCQLLMWREDLEGGGGGGGGGGDRWVFHRGRKEAPHQDPVFTSEAPPPLPRRRRASCS